MSAVPTVACVAGSEGSSLSAEDVELSEAGPEDRSSLFELFAGIVERREGFPHSPPLSDADFEASWGATVAAVVAARAGTEVVGAYYLRPNSVGRAAHIANGGYMVAPPWRCRGVGRMLVEHSLVRARALSFDAMQFNLVFESNPARRLYEDLGFQVVGRIPRAVEGEDALVYWRSLDA